MCMRRKVRISPGGGRQNGLQSGHAAVHRDQEVDVGERRRVVHGLGVIFIIDPEVGAAAVASPA